MKKPWRQISEKVQRISENQVDFLVLSFCAILFFYLMPMAVLNSDPASGGDTGSHFWPLKTLFNEGLPKGHVRVWNPGNLGGEPHLTHYFPFPFLLMSFFSFLMPLGRAFNIGTIMPVLALPFCIYICLKNFKVRFPIPIIATATSLVFLYNESFSMWGGNLLSTLAGQFAYLYALDFLFLGMASLQWEILEKRTPYISMFLFSAVLLSHFYIALLLPFVFLLFLFIHREIHFFERIKIFSKTVVGTLALSIWFVGPLIENAPWTTAFPINWSSQNIIKETIPFSFIPILFFAIISLVLIVLKNKRFLTQKNTFHEIFISFFFCLFTFLSLGFYFIFPKIGLVDVRLLPVLQCSFLILCSFAIGWYLIQKNSKFQKINVLIIGILFILWSHFFIVQGPNWLSWNYSGWQGKHAYKYLQGLTKSLNGSFSDGRVIYENHAVSNNAGSIRVFEMLPYFSNRSTLESVYLQATILAPAAFYLQSLISITPSCPFIQYSCSRPDLQNLEKYLNLLAVQQLILITPPITQTADKTSFLKAKEIFQPWHIYDYVKKVSYVDVPQSSPLWIPEENYKNVFYTWLKSLSQNDRYLIVDRQNDKSQMEQKIQTSIDPNRKCHPQIQVDYDQISLSTDCVGLLHVLKFAFHPTWKASSGDRLFLLSPGFIGLIPSQERINLKWGQSVSWTIYNSISWITFAIIALFLVHLELKNLRSQFPFKKRQKK